MSQEYQGSLTIRKSGDNIAVRIEGGYSDLRQEEDGSYTLYMGVGEDSVEVGLSPTALQTLGLQCVMFIPELLPQHTIASVEDSYRFPARLIGHMDNRSMQLMLRETQADDLTTFLWYMKDAELIRKVCRNMSKRAAELLVEDMEQRWRGKDPDTTLESEAGVGRTAVLEILSIVRRLADEGQIPHFYGVNR